MRKNSKLLLRLHCKCGCATSHLLPVSLRAHALLLPLMSSIYFVAFFQMTQYKFEVNHYKKARMCPTYCQYRRYDMMKVYRDIFWDENAILWPILRPT
jgi:hypothetical protein